MKHLLMDAKREIESLRSRNAVLEAKADTLEIFAAALGLRNGSRGMAVDVAWELGKKIDELAAQEKPE